MTNSRKGLIITAVALLTVICIGANVAGIMFFDTITTYLCGSGINFEMSGLSDALAASDDLIRDIQEEGSVLVKNDDNCLPLTKDEISRVNVFGWRHIDNGWIAGASGSVFGNNKSNLERVTTLLEGLEANNIEWNTNLTQMYEDYYNVHDGKCLEVGEVYYAVSEPDASYYTEELIKEAQEFSNVAIVVIGRNGGEGADLPLYQQVRKSDGSIEKRTDRNYLELTQEEEDMIKIAAENFEKTIVLINSVYSCSYDFLDKYDVEACLWVSGGGQAGAYSIPKLLSGKVNPSGKLTYTVPYDFRDDPSYYNGSSVGGGGAHASYVEDIYIGYRWFETADEEGYWNNRTRTFEKTLQGGGTETIDKTGYDAVVQFPFGHGLSYTDFEWKVEDFASTDTVLKADSVISVDVTVTNVGSVKGKEVVQLYATPPYTTGGIEKASVNLVAFDKTMVLRPGESETLTLSFTLSDIASYDCYDKNNNGFMGYELEAGDYVISLRRDAHNLANTENAKITYTLGSDIKIETDPITGAKVENRFTGDSAYSGMPIDGTGSDQGQIPLMTRADFTGTFPTGRTPNRTGSKVTASQKHIYEPTGDEILVEMPKQGDGSAGKYLFYTKEDGSPANGTELRTGEGLVINKELMMELGNPDNYDSEKWEEVLSQLSIEDMKILTKCGGYRTEHIVSVGKMYCFDNDGGSGMLRHINTNDAINPNREQWSLFGTTSMTAATWNTELYYSVGNSIAAEGVLSGINGWYAPSCNLVRSPFGGRGSEYGSEDPLIAGMTAAEAVRGATTNGLYTYVKHFAVNQSESGRAGKFTWLSEQSLRELYLKTFQITVQHGKTNGIMTAMNRLGANWTGGNHALVTEILRDEWGFKGCVITDYVDPKSDAGSYGWFKQGIYAGNDLFLSNASTRNNLGLGGWEDDPTYIGFARKACKNILYSRANAYYVSQTTEVETGSKIDTDMIVVSEQPFAWWVIPVAGLDVVLVGAIVLLLMSLFSGGDGFGKKILKLLIVILMVASVAVSAGYSYVMITKGQIAETSVQAIMIKQLPTKTEYWDGELFDPTGLVLVVQYADGTVDENVTEGFDWDLKGPLTADNDEVKISMGDKAKYVEISVNIRTPISLKVTQKPNKLAYAIGEKFDPQCIELVATYDDGSQRVLTSGFMYPTTKMQEGTDSVTIRYNGKSVDLRVLVTPVAKEIKIVSGPIQTSYMAGQFFDPAGMSIVAIFEDGTSIDITKYVNLSTHRLGANDTKLSLEVLGQTLEQALTITPNPHVKANAYAEVPATCTEDGTKAYVTCSHCDKYFTDEHMAYEIADLIIEKHHVLAASEENPASGSQIRKCIRCDSDYSETPEIYYNFTKADIIDKINTKLTDTANSSSNNIKNANQFAYKTQYMLNFKQEGDGVQFSFVADKSGKVAIVLKMSSAYFKSIYRNDGEKWVTGDMQLNKVADIKFNGDLVDFADNVILYGSDSLKGSVAGTTEGNQTYANTVNWQYITFEAYVSEGENTITVQTKYCTEYPDINNTSSGYSSFALDTVAVYGDIFYDDSDSIEISDTIKRFTYEFTADDQSANNVNNPPEGRFSLKYHSITTATSANIKKALALASNGDYVTHFYNGAAVTKSFTSTVEGKATVTFKIASGYMTRMENYSIYETGDMIVNKIMKFTVNGVDVVLSDDVVLRGNTTRKDYSCMGVWTDISFEMDVKIGENTIVLTSIFPDDGNGNSLYVDPGETGTQSSFQLDTVTVSMGDHEYRTEWESDETSHWHACTVDGCTDIADIAGHTWNEGEITTEPTEEAEGEKLLTCTVCGHTKTAPVDKLPHSHKYEDEWSKDADYHWYAPTCGHFEALHKFAHTWNEGEVTKSPSENEEGVKTFTCTACGQTKTEAIDKIIAADCDLNSEKSSFTHNFTLEDQSAQNNHNPPEGRYSLTYYDSSATSANIQKVLPYAYGNDYLTHFYGGAAVSVNFTSTVEGKATVTFKMSSGYITKMQNFALYETGDMVVNKIMKITANGKDVVFGDDVVLKGDTTRQDYSCMGMWTLISFEMDVQIGENTVVLTSLYPVDESGNTIYNDPGKNGTQSAFNLDTMLVSMGVHEHSFGNWTKVDDANHERSCECGASETAEHSWNDGTVTTEPTHLEFGVKTYTCSVCSGTKTEEIAKIADHSFGDWTKVDDANHERSCECGEKETAEHSWNDGAVTTEPTHLEFGVKTYTCSVCSGTKTEEIAKIAEHSFSDWARVDDANHQRSCACGESETAEHAWDEGEITKEPTEEEEGIKLYTCSVCSATKTVLIGTLSHTHKFATEWSYDADYHWYATTCGHDAVEGVITKISHAWDDGVQTKAPTHLEEGEKTYTCTDCGQTKTVDIAKIEEHIFDNACDTDCPCGHTRETEHAWDDGVVTKDPTENSNGVKTYTCICCGHTKTENIDRIEVGDITSENTSFTHNFVAADQSAKNNSNPPEKRFNLSYFSHPHSSANVNKALALAENNDYLTHFYGGAAVTKTFTSSVSGKATVIFKIASGNFTNGILETGDMVVNKIMKFTVNGVDVVLSDDVVLKGDKTQQSYACMGMWTDVTFEIDVKAGVNTIVLTSIYPVDESGKTIYNDPGENGTQSSFQLDTMTVNLTAIEYDLTDETNSLVHNFTAADQSAQNNSNPPQNRLDVNYVSTENASTTAQKATKLATNEDYLSYFYGGAAVTKIFTSSVSGKATVTFKIASGYLITGANGVYQTDDMVVNKVMKFTVNGVDVVLGDDVVLKGDNTTNNYACMANWTYITFEIDVMKGVNTIVLTSLFPGYQEDGTTPLYKDPGSNGTQSSFHLDTVTVTLK